MEIEPITLRKAMSLMLLVLKVILLCSMKAKQKIHVTNDLKKVCSIVGIWSAGMNLIKDCMTVKQAVLTSIYRTPFVKNVFSIYCSNVGEVLNRADVIFN